MNDIRLTERSYRRDLAYLITGMTIFRLIYVNFVPLVSQEAYYWKYAKHLALSYFDHPPLTAYIIAFFTWIGGDSAFFVRLGAIILSAGMSILLYSIVTRLFKNERWAFLAVLAANCTVILSLGATVMTPDTPLLFFWTLIIYSLVRLKESDNGRWWYLAGLGLGLGLLSKYSAILIAPGVLMYVLSSRAQRKWLLTAHPYLAMVFALLVFSPVLIWNHQNDWASFAFQLPNRFGNSTGLRHDFALQLFLTQLGLLTPFVFLLAVAGWLRSGWVSVRDRDARHSLLFWIACPAYVIFGLSSLVRLVKMNWLAPAYVTSIIAGIVWLNSGQTGCSARLRRYFKPGLILGLAIALVAHMLPLVPLSFMRKFDTWSGWRELGSRVVEVKQEMGPETFIFGTDYPIPSEITFYTSSHEPTHSREIIGEEGLQYDHWTNFEDLIGKNAIFVTSDFKRYRHMDRIEQHFDSVEEDAPLEILQGNSVVRVFYIYRCYGYNGPVPSR